MGTKRHCQKRNRSSKSKTKKRSGRSQKSVSAASVSRASIGGKNSVAALSVGPGAGGPQPAGLFGEQSQQVMCPQCNKQVQTMTSFTPGVCTYVLCCVTTPCCWIPFLMDCAKDVEHRCPTCGYFFGKYQRLNL